jgi:ComF family protein
LFLDACLATVSYQFPWTDCVARFKFRADPGLGRGLADLMRHAPWVEPALERASCVVAMPLSRARLRERGFNQAFELARHLVPSKADAHTLQRTEPRAHQVGASRDERLANVRDTFWVDPSRLHHVRGQRLVLIDDVMTTGASLNEAARALKTAGALHVTGIVFARTEAPSPP